MTQPKETFYLAIIFMLTSNFIWSAKIALVFKAVFFSALFAMTLAFMFIFLELDKLRMKNI